MAVDERLANNLSAESHGGTGYSKIWPLVGAPPFLLMVANDQVWVLLRLESTGCRFFKADADISSKRSASSAECRRFSMEGG